VDFSIFVKTSKIIDFSGNIPYQKMPNPCQTANIRFGTLKTVIFQEKHRSLGCKKVRI
jgi:hypothetical protein